MKTIDLTNNQSALDAAFEEVFSIAMIPYDRARSIKGPLPTPMFNHFLNIIDSSGVIGWLEAWHKIDRPSHRGRKAHVSPRAVLLCFMLNSFWSLGYGYIEVSETLANRFTPKQREILELRGNHLTPEDWYKPAHRASMRMRKLIDPWHKTSLQRRLTGPEFEQALTHYSPEREARAHEFANALVEASMRAVPARYLADYRGDIALDSTAIPIRGRRNPSKDADKRNGVRDRNNGDFQPGLYLRTSTDHDGNQQVSKSFPAYELDTPSLIDARFGNYAFTFITSCYLHLPSEIKVGPRVAVEKHAEQFPQRGMIVADRAFNGLQSENFQLPVRKLGYETGFDYTSKQLGLQAGVPGHPVIIVDGVPFVDRMTEEFKNINRLYKAKAIDPKTGKAYTLETVKRIVELRKAYRMKAHTKADRDGFQRFRYPDPRTYLAFDPVTGKPTKGVPVTTMTLEPDIAVLKHLQKYEWGSPEWAVHYGQRSQVESTNSALKEARGADLGDESMRPGRGFAYTYIAAAVAIVITNLTQFIRGLKKLYPAGNKKPKTRASRRKDHHGRPLSRTTTDNVRQTEEAPPPPLQQ